MGSNTCYNFNVIFNLFNLLNLLAINLCIILSVTPTLCGKGTTAIDELCFQSVVTSRLRLRMLVVAAYTNNKININES